MSASGNVEQAEGGSVVVARQQLVMSGDSSVILQKIAMDGFTWYFVLVIKHWAFCENAFVVFGSGVKKCFRPTYLMFRQPLSLRIPINPHHSV